MKVAVLGSGSWGTALAIALAENQHDVWLWGRNAEHLDQMNQTRKNEKYLKGVELSPRINIEQSIEKAVTDKDVIVMSVSSQAVRTIMKRISNHISHETIIVDTAKGIEKGSLKRLSEIAEEELPNNQYVVFSGPSHAEEVSKGLPTTIVAASNCKESAEIVQDLFMSSRMRIYTNPDVIGVELGGALKNIIALGVGISDGLGFGDNAKAALMTRGMAEISRLGLSLGANANTFSGLSGIGDLIVTCTSEHSRNRRCGLLLGTGVNSKDAIEQIGMVVEGVTTTEGAFHLSKKHEIEMPITEQIYYILYKDANVKEAVINLMTRQKKHEIEEVVEGEVLGWE